ASVGFARPDQCDLGPVRILGYLPVLFGRMDPRLRLWTGSMSDSRHSPAERSNIENAVVAGSDGTYDTPGCGTTRTADPGDFSSLKPDRPPAASMTLHALLPLPRPSIRPHVNSIGSREMYRST